MKSEAQILLERKAWARARLLVAWLKISKAPEIPDLTAEQLDELDSELHEAMAIAAEWAIDPRAVLEERARQLTPREGRP